MREKIPPFRIGDELTRRRMEQLRRAAAREVTADAPLAVSQTPSGSHITHRAHPRTWWVGTVHSTHTDFSGPRYRMTLQRVTNSADSTSDLLTWGSQVYPYSDTVVVQNLAEESTNTHYLPTSREAVVYPIEDESLPTKRRWVMDVGPPMCIDSYHPKYSDENWKLAVSSDITGSAGNSDHWHVLGHMYQESDTAQMNPWMAIDPAKMFCVDDTYNPSGNGMTEPAGSDATGAPAISSDAFVTGHMYLESDTGLYNPWFVLDPTKLGVIASTEALEADPPEATTCSDHSAAQTDAWDRTEGHSVSLYIMTRLGTDAGTGTVYAYHRKFTWTHAGTLESISAETRTFHNS